MAELHIIGQLLGAKGFDGGMYCRWGIDMGDAWRILEGYADGRTQIDHPGDGDMSYWEHPFDIHLATSSIAGWPRIHVQVWREDFFGRKELAGYGFGFIPTTVGEHKLEISCWKPTDASQNDALKASLLGGGPVLLNENVIHQQEDRFRLYTETAGTVVVEAGVILKDFEQHGVEVNRYLDP
eukprot:TRINITY_DN3303_c0_g1_i5.p1 TRINITY_DN3303_c0_g1~~TRINITY_DN3303_c0_g1_i5.p1  ORF type:complete len:182 (+),score=25.39 TRINITY_DN3303_c0_g1_i5:175-720(+)